MKQVFPWRCEDEGGLHRIYPGRRGSFDYLNRAVKAAGYVPGEEIRFAMDAAASELWDETRGAYFFQKPDERQRDPAGYRGNDPLLSDAVGRLRPLVH